MQLTEPHEAIIVTSIIAIGGDVETPLLSGPALRDDAGETAAYADHIEPGDAIMANPRLSSDMRSGVRVENSAMAGVTIRDADLSGAAIGDCGTSNMRINGYLVSDLIAAYRKSE